MAGLLGTCFECGNPADHNHHVVPRIFGGTKTVPLCVLCHGLVHERSLSTSELIKEGQAKAVSGGSKLGRLRKCDYGKVKEMKKAGVPTVEIARVMGVHPCTIHRIVTDFYKPKYS